MQMINPRVLKRETVPACSTARVREDRQTDSRRPPYPCLVSFFVLVDKILNCVKFYDTFPNLPTPL